MADAPNYKAELVGVFGYPVAEDPTVVMHEAAYARLGLNWRYLTIEVLPQDLEVAMKGMRAMNMRGINLTISHKFAGLRYLDEVKPAAAVMEAVNSIVRVADRLIGENTDGKGFMTALTKGAGFVPKGKKVVLLGAGGAADGTQPIAWVSPSERKGPQGTIETGCPSAISLSSSG